MHNSDSNFKGGKLVDIILDVSGQAEVTLIYTSVTISSTVI